MIEVKNLSHFGKIFKDATNMTPTQYRSKTDF